MCDGYLTPAEIQAYLKNHIGMPRSVCFGVSPPPEVPGKGEAADGGQTAPFGSPAAMLEDEHAAKLQAEVD